jgi:cell division septation protein DedD
LDGSPSLGDGKNVEQIRSLAKNVINQLYNAVSNPVSKLTIQPKPVQPPQSAVSQPVPIQPPIKQPPQVTAKPPVAPRHTPPVTRQQPTPAPSYTQDVPKYVQFVDAWISGPYNGGYWVQVGAFQNSENIRRVTSALQNRNYRVDTSLTIVQDGIFLRRVLVGGPYSRAGAENELRVIRETVLLLPS